MASRAGTGGGGGGRPDRGGEGVFAPSQPGPTLLSTAIVVTGFGVVTALVTWRIVALIGAGREAFPESLTWFDPLAVISVGLALAVGYRLFNPPVPPTRLLLVPARLHRVAGSIAEASVFRVGSLGDWTLTNPAVEIQHLHRPGPEETVREALSSLGQPAPAGRPGDQLVSSLRSRPVPPPVRRGRAGSSGAAPPPKNRYRSRASDRASDRASASPHRPTVPTDDWIQYTTLRGDTYWTLAERLFGQGGHWALIRDANVGRAVAPGVVLETSMSLRSGWSILIPAAGTGPPSGKDL